MLKEKSQNISFVTLTGLHKLDFRLQIGNRKPVTTWSTEVKMWAFIRQDVISGIMGNVYFHMTFSLKILYSIYIYFAYSVCLFVLVLIKV